MVHDTLADALAEQPFEDSGVPGADDDQIGVSVIRELRDRVGWLAYRRHVLGLDASGLEEFSRVLELFPVLVRRIDRIDRSRTPCGSDEDRCDARDDELRAEGLGEVGGALESAAGGLCVVEPDDDGLELHPVSLPPFVQNITCRAARRPQAASGRLRPPETPRGGTPA